MSLGFYVDLASCIGCKTCQVACKETYKLPVNNLYRKVYNYQGGSWKPTEAGHYVPEGVFGYFVSLACNHCTNPACVANCPTGAMYKDAETGMVLHDDEACIGCQTCVQSCPYEIPQYLADVKIVRKCDMCADLVMRGERPACVDACPMRCLEWDDFDELSGRYGSAVRNVGPLPSEDQTQPCSLINAKAEAMGRDFERKYI